MVFSWPRTEQRSADNGNRAAGLAGFSYAPYAPARAVFSSFVAVLDIALVFMIFSIVDGVLLRPLPYTDAHGLVRLYQTNAEQGLRNAATSLLDFEDWRQQTRSFGAMAAYQYGPVIVTGRGDPIELETAFIAGDFFGTLECRPRSDIRCWKGTFGRHSPMP